jgi:hypothetical protein
MFGAVGISYVILLGGAAFYSLRFHGLDTTDWNEPHLAERRSSDSAFFNHEKRKMTRKAGPDESNRLVFAPFASFAVNSNSRSSLA